MSDKVKIKCKDCPYYTGVQCHGHGEYWGECVALDDKLAVLRKMFEKEHVYVEHIDCWSTVRGDNSNCAFFEIRDYTEVNNGK